MKQNYLVGQKKKKWRLSKTGPAVQIFKVGIIEPYFSSKELTLPTAFSFAFGMCAQFKKPPTGSPVFISFLKTKVCVTLAGPKILVNH